MSLKDNINALGELHITLKQIICFIVILLIILFFFKEQALFEKLLMILVPFLIGTSVKMSLVWLGIFA